MPGQSAPQRGASRRHHARSRCTPSNSVLRVRRKSDSRGLSIKDDLVRLELVSQETPARAFCWNPNYRQLRAANERKRLRAHFKTCSGRYRWRFPQAPAGFGGVLATARHRQLVDSTSADRETVLREKFRDLGASQKFRLLC